MRADAGRGLPPLSSHGVSAGAGFVGLGLLFGWEYGMSHMPFSFGGVSFGMLFYLASAAGLLTATLFTRSRVPGPRAVAVLDVCSGMGMAVAGGALALDALPLAAAAGLALLGGFGATWLFVRWGTAFAKLGVRASIASACLAMVIAAGCKAALGALGAPWGAVLLVLVAVAAAVCLGLLERGVRGGALAGDEGAAAAPMDGRRFRSFMVVCFGIAAFSFTASMAQAVIPDGPYVLSGPVVLLDSALEAGLAVGLVVWVVALRRRLSFNWSWRALLVLTAAALALIPYASLGPGGLAGSPWASAASAFGGVEGVVLALVRTVQSIIVSLWFLALADIVRHNGDRQYATFAIGWCAYALPCALGGLFGVALTSFGAPAVLLLSVAAPVLIAVAFLVDETSLAGRRLFQYPEDAPAQDAPAAGADGAPAAGMASPAGEGDGAAAPGAPGSPEEGEAAGPQGAAAPVAADPLSALCDAAAGRYGLTGREREVLELLLRGRSKVYIAETLFISENTVRGHVKRIYAKLDVHDRQELIDQIEGRPR